MGNLLGLATDRPQHPLRRDKEAAQVDPRLLLISRCPEHVGHPRRQETQQPADGQNRDGQDVARDHVDRAAHRERHLGTNGGWTTTPIPARGPPFIGAIPVAELTAAGQLRAFFHAFKLYSHFTFDGDKKQVKAILGK